MAAENNCRFTSAFAVVIVSTPWALAELVTRKLVAKEVNPRDNRETLVCLTKAGLAAHDTIVAGAQERNRRLLEQLSKDELKVLLDQIDRLTDAAAQMLADEKDLN